MHPNLAYWFYAVNLCSRPRALWVRAALTSQIYCARLKILQKS